MEYGGAENVWLEHARDRGQDRNATRQMVVCGPTMEVVSLWTKLGSAIKTYLDLQEIITSDTLVMHLVVGIIGIATALVFNKSEPTFRVNEIRNETDQNWCY